MLRRLTEKQSYVFIAVCNGLAENGVPPSLTEILRRVPMDVNKNTIFYHLKAIEKKGYVKNELGKYLPTREGIQQRMADFNPLKARTQPQQDSVGATSNTPTGVGA